MWQVTLQTAAAGSDKETDGTGEKSQHAPSESSTLTFSTVEQRRYFTVMRVAATSNVSGSTCLANDGETAAQFSPLVVVVGVVVDVVVDVVVGVVVYLLYLHHPYICIISYTSISSSSDLFFPILPLPYASNFYSSFLLDLSPSHISRHAGVDVTGGSEIR